MVNTVTYERNWALSELVTAVLGAGLHLAEPSGLSRVGTPLIQLDSSFRGAGLYDLTFGPLSAWGRRR